MSIRRGELSMHLCKSIFQRWFSFSLISVSEVFLLSDFCLNVEWYLPLLLTTTLDLDFVDLCILKGWRGRSESSVIALFWLSWWECRVRRKCSNDSVSKCWRSVGEVVRWDDRRLRRVTAENESPPHERNLLLLIYY